LMGAVKDEQFQNLSYLTLKLCRICWHWSACTQVPSSCANRHSKHITSR
jgi:hypothetical protein